MTMRFFAHNKTFDVDEVGILRLKPLPQDKLSVGRVGYVYASVKEVQDTKVGDTITDANNPASQALPGYREVKPMVFSSLYPSDSENYEELRVALEKLKLNDSALTYTPEDSTALGFGFRCGFLGLLHMEIVQERLEREYDLDLVTTVPSVIYSVTKTTGEVVLVNNPMKLPDPSKIELIEEPYVKASIMAPVEYLGNMMQLAQDRRGVYLNTEYIDDTRANLHYELPLGEVIFDFYDRLKSLSKGYASLDYEFIGFRVGKLQKVDVLLNHEIVDALSVIVHSDKAYDWGRRICEKLKDLIPRQLYEIAIQAAIGSKVISRSTIPAMRKNVTAKCYGGDISRKRKLLEKQKEGKRRMKQLGKVEIPQEAFMAILKVD
jgi:GTP-binding protein LepA